jgi:predicted nucleotidyltransferase
LADVEVVEGLKLVPIQQIVSFRGRFCEQAINGEVIEAQGKVELVTNKKTGSEFYRLILGNRPSDYMILKH